MAFRYLGFIALQCELLTLSSPFTDRVNFVMLNVDNTKWQQELDEFGI
jgi:hypothetical protein